MDLFRKKIKIDYEKYFNEYFNIVYRRAYYLMTNASAAEDIAQETFLKLYTNPPDTLDNVKGWLLKVATNLAINSMKSATSRNRREEDDCVRQIEAYSLNVEDAAITKMATENVLHVLSEMQWRDRSILYLKYSGMSYDEIAQEVGVEKNAVGVLLSRARNKFHKAYMLMDKI